MQSTPPVIFVLVEDDDLDAEVFRRALKKHKIDREVRLAKDGGEGMEVLRRDFLANPNQNFIVFLDLNMPGLNGHDFLDEIRSDDDLRSSVVFVLTTSQHDRDVRKAYNRNIAGYFTKANIDLLMETIKPFVGGAQLPPIGKG